MCYSVAIAIKFDTHLQAHSKFNIDGIRCTLVKTVNPFTHLPDSGTHHTGSHCTGKTAFQLSGNVVKAEIRTVLLKLELSFNLPIIFISFSSTVLCHLCTSAHTSFVPVPLCILVMYYRLGTECPRAFSEITIIMRSDSYPLHCENHNF